MAQFINWALIFLNSAPCSGFVSTSAHITPAGQSTILTSLQYTMYLSTARGSSLAINDRTMDVQVTSDRPSTP